MLLRHLFEAASSEVAIIFGRFNPPHKGHRAAWEMASESPVWFVGTNQSTVGPKDPLPFDVKVEAMKTIWPEVESHIVAETSWLTLASEVYKKHPKATLLCLTDEDWVTKTIIQYNGKEGPHGFYNFPRITQKPTPRLSSATALRDAVAKGDRAAFSQAAGVSADTKVAGKPFFDLVAEYLLPYQNAPKKVAKKKKETEVAEMDSQGYKGSRDDYELGKGKEHSGKPVKAKDMAKKSLSVLHKSLDRALSKEKKASPAQVQRNKERWAKRQAERDQDVGEGYDKWGWHTSVTNGEFMPTKYGNKAYVYLHDMDNESPRGGPQLVTVNKPTVAKRIAKQFGAKVVKTDLNTYRIVKPAEQDVAEVSKGTLDRYVSKAVDSHGHADFAARMSKDDPTKRSYHKDQKHTAEKRRQGISRALDRMSKDESIEEGSLPPSPKPQWSKEQAAKRQHTQKELKRAQFLKKKAEQPPTKGMSNSEKADKGWRNPNVDESLLDEYGNTAKGQKMLTKVQKRAVDRVTSKKADTDPAYAKKNKDTADRAWDRMKDVAEGRAWHSTPQSSMIGINGKKTNAKPASDSKQAEKSFTYQGYTIKFSPNKREIYKGGELIHSKEGDYSSPTKLQLSTAKSDVSRLMARKEDVAEDWNKVNRKDKTDGLSQKAVNAYRRENPGSKLQTAVTTKPSKLKAGSKDAKRRKSFCARMSGNKGPMKDEKGRPTPKAKALARWNCNEDVDLKTSLQELSNELLGNYKKAASADASKADKEGNFKRGDKRFSGIVKATKKQFDNDSKKNK